MIHKPDSLDRRIIPTYLAIVNSERLSPFFLAALSELGEPVKTTGFGPLKSTTMKLCE